MLIGQHIHKFDDKNRLSLPAKFRKELGKAVVLTYGLDQCVFVYSIKEWKVFSKKLAQLSMGQSDTRAFNRFLQSGAVETIIDASGRVLVPDFLREYASLSETAVVTGIINRVELWNEKVFATYTNRVVKRADRLAERLGEIGMI